MCSKGSVHPLRGGRSVKLCHDANLICFTILSNHITMSHHIGNRVGQSSGSRMDRGCHVSPRIVPTITSRSSCRLQGYRGISETRNLIVSRTSSTEQSAAQTLAAQPEASSSSKALPASNVWEIDFCSRPLLDERNKKVWELLICDPDRTFEYSEYFPNSRINSAEVGG